MEELVPKTRPSLFGKAVTENKERMNMKRVLKYLDDNIERVIIIISYFMMAAIIFEEVIKRFFFKTQAPWSVQIPIYLFLILAWIGAS